ncbi:flagellar basal-body rod protein FlgF [Marinibactrum halimedae]|uniref:Flagellar basal-body rod protein FlgF n=1 Tax=Marinibactrum halimedae TaxID=1444977 RepID=A0AA37T7I7_9GAMM|nr:flagellar basal-body rod protein FlgF [Marinibactrum halimedae]MCD9458390.1 flagellar basal-body rod protein FlgF [Marinibactrum halimedae]GLS26087.1 flagellar basal-body rod protein FlgF [Marinibactrum halimedae]
MDRALYISMTGAKNNMMAQTARANNLANANTTGFRADFEQSRSMPIYYGEGHPTRAYALTERPATNFEQGPLNETGRSLDVAIRGEGFIVVQAPDGTEALTRAGNMQLDAAGILRTGNGLPVLGNGGIIAVPPQESIEIAADGTITVAIQGQGPEALAVINRIQLANPDSENLEKGTDGLFRLKNEDPILPDPDVELISGFLEGSNVNVIDEFTKILSQSRQYEMQVKMMSKVDEMSESSGRLLQIS